MWFDFRSQEWRAGKLRKFYEASKILNSAVKYYRRLSESDVSNVEVEPQVGSSIRDRPKTGPTAPISSDVKPTGSYAAVSLIYAL